MENERGGGWRREDAHRSMSGPQWAATALVVLQREVDGGGVRRLGLPEEIVRNAELTTCRGGGGVEMGVVRGGPCRNVTVS